LGTIENYIDPPSVHPGSILWRSRYEPTEPEFDILGAQRPYWGRRGVHYHQFLSAGENTLNLQLLQLTIDDVMRSREYSRDRAIARYIEFLRNPDGHRDTYVEECHRGFFENLRRGRSPDQCAVSEKHIGGMVPVIPLWAVLRTIGYSDEAAREAVRDHVAITHAGKLVRRNVDTVLTVAAEVWDGALLADVIAAHSARQDLPGMQGPIARLAADPPERVIGRVFSPACYLDDALPATWYLALRYAGDPRAGLIANTMAGGDNCHRGAVLGALFGLECGASGFPEEWVSGLKPPVATDPVLHGV
jgi:ADP-ribosylglycohydrolase